jgi:simple sugar transport system permease protein
MLCAGILGGAVWALIPAVFKIKLGMSEIISTLMLNYIAILLMQYLARGPLREPGGYLPTSARFDPVTRLPLILNSRIHFGLLIVVALIPLVYFLLWYTPVGFRLRAVGSRASVARYAGINVEKTIVFALMLSGSFAGLAGIIEVSSLYTRLKGGISGGYGFSGILVALLGRTNPIGVVFAAVFFASLTIGAETMHVVSGIPPELASAIQAVIVLSVLAVDALVRWRKS